jgi:hypothetical protein
MPLSTSGFQNRSSTLVCFTIHIGETGFEPATSASQTQRSTRLSHSPVDFIDVSIFMEVTGFEPATLALQTRCSPTELHPHDVFDFIKVSGLIVKELRSLYHKPINCQRAKL